MTDNHINTNWSIIRYIDELEHDYGYLIKHTTAYVCPGWMQLIRDMLGEIHATTWPDFLKEDCEYFDTEHPIFTTIKEKYGTLRVYGYNINDSQQAIIDKYERLSATVCGECGAPGQMHVKHGWYYVACDEHANGGQAISWEDGE